MQRRKILVTTALPYANGPIHMGHMVEYIQADIWVRFQRLIGNECYFFCADDTHGTPIYIRARNEKRTPENLIEEMFKLHTGTFKNFSISFDHYSSTNTPTTRELSENIYRAMRDKGHTATKKITQTYCTNDKMFLPDRLVRGTCPKCKSPNQYGDSCDVCGSTYAPTDLIQPSCSICGTPPTLKESEHIFFKLNDFKKELTEWVPKITSPEITKKLNEWLKEDLRDWDISRDEPYFGFKIPDTENKYFYVWVDAPIGYMASSKDFFAKNPAAFEEFWKSDKTEVYHFIGKDIVYFHTLFWPAMLHNAGYRIPSAVNVHGFLTVNGEKMSKSKGTFVNADTYLKHLDPSFLRYYYASKLTDGLDDIDLNLEDFVLRVNSDLVGKFINLGSRSAQMLHKSFGGKLAKLNDQSVKFYQNTVESYQKDIAQFYENREFSKAMSAVRECADKMNKYFDEVSPWKSIKEDQEGAHQCLTLALVAFRALGIYLQPVLPGVTENIAKLFGESQYTWKQLSLDTLKTETLQPFTHLMQRVDGDKVKAMIEDSKVAQAAGNAAAAPAAKANDGYIEIDDFNKIDLRIAKVIAAEEVKDSDKLLQLKVSLGAEERTILAGIKKAYKPETLVGRQLLIVANLKPRKMKFGTSEGMVLCASEGESLFVLSPDSGAAVGSKVK